MGKYAEIINKINRDIEGEPGWSLVGVCDEPAFVYTIGLWKNYLSPEIMIIGLPVNTAAILLNDAASKIKNGTQSYTSGIQYTDLLRGYPVEFKTIHPSHIDKYCTPALIFYSHEYPTLQLFWTDETGKFPWESSNINFKQMQPDLSEISLD